MSGIQGTRWVSLGTSIQGDIGKQPTVAITAQQGQGNKELRCLKDEGVGTPPSKQSRGAEVLGEGEGSLAWELKQLDDECQL